MKGKLWKETICIYAAETIISWATQRMTRNRLILLKKGLICHFLPEVVKSKDVGGFQNRLNTLVGFTVSSELVCHTALWCGVADLEWWPSQGVLSLCDWFSPWAVAHLDILSIPFLFLCSQFFISISRWFQRGSQEKEKRRTGPGLVIWLHLETLLEGETGDNWLVVGHISPVWRPPKSASEPVTSSVSLTGVKEMGASKW